MKKSSNRKEREAKDRLEGPKGLLCSRDLMFSRAWFWRWGGVGIAFFFYGHWGGDCISLGLHFGIAVMNF